MCVEDWKVEAACPVTFCGWIGDGLEYVGEAEEFFARVSFEVDQRMGAPAECRWLYNWVDETPRDEMRRSLAEEVRLALSTRERKVA
jgi:hypothetical protein